MAQIEFFSTIKDEINLINHIAKDDLVKCSKIENKRFVEWINLCKLKIPESDLPFEICLWNSDFDQLKWLTSEPKIDTKDHRKLVNSLFTKEHWIKEKEQNNFDKMIDNENSPILYYSRGEIVYDYRLPNVILSPQSSIDNLGNDFKKWFNRITSWIRRNGDIVFSYKISESKFRNDMSLLNTIYALPNAKAMIDSDKHNFALSINTRKFDK